MEAVILCGGLGTRLRPLTNNKPKALVEVGGKPIIEWQLKWLKKYGIEREDIILACGVKHETLKNYFGDSVKYSIEDKPLGTGGALKQALGLVKGKEFLVFNVDDLNNININELKKLGSNSICITKMRAPFAVIDTEGSYVKSYIEKPLLDLWVSMGVYLLNKDIEKFLPDKGSIERDVFPKLELKAYKHNGYWHTINSIRDAENFDPEEFEQSIR